MSTGIPIFFPNSNSVDVCLPCHQIVVDPTFVAAAVAALSTYSQLHDLRVTSTDATMQFLMEMQIPVHAADD